MDVFERGAADEYEHADVERRGDCFLDRTGVRANHGVDVSSCRRQVALGRQTVLLVTRNLPPLRGGMERLNAHLAQELAVQYRVIVVGPRGCSSLATDDIVVYQAPGTSILVFLAWATAMSIWLTLRYRPAVILGGSGLVAPVVRLAGMAGGHPYGGVPAWPGYYRGQ